MKIQILRNSSWNIIIRLTVNLNFTATEPVPSPLTPYEIHNLTFDCENSSFGIIANDTPSRLEDQYIGFKHINPKPEPFRIQLLRCNKYFAYTVSRDGRYMIVLITYEDWITDNVDGDVFYIVARFANKYRPQPTDETPVDEYHGDK